MHPIRVPSSPGGGGPQQTVSFLQIPEIFFIKFKKLNTHAGSKVICGDSEHTFFKIEYLSTHVVQGVQGVGV
jgi:hypothetical protein